MSKKSNIEHADVANYKKTVSRNGWMRRIQVWTFGKYVPEFGGYCPFFWFTWFCVAVAPLTAIMKFVEVVFKGLMLGLGGLCEYLSDAGFFEFIGGGITSLFSKRKLTEEEQRALAKRKHLKKVLSTPYDVILHIRHGYREFLTAVRSCRDAIKDTPVPGWDPKDMDAEDYVRTYLLSSDLDLSFKPLWTARDVAGRADDFVSWREAVGPQWKTIVDRAEAWRKAETLRRELREAAEARRAASAERRRLAREKFVKTIVKWSPYFFKPVTWLLTCAAGLAAVAAVFYLVKMLIFGLGPMMLNLLTSSKFWGFVLHVLTVLGIILGAGLALSVLLTVAQRIWRTMSVPYKERKAAVEPRETLMEPSISPVSAFITGLGVFASEAVAFLHGSLTMSYKQNCPLLTWSDDEQTPIEKRSTDEGDSNTNTNTNT